MCRASYDDALLSRDEVTLAAILEEALVNLDCQEAQRAAVHARLGLFQRLQLNLHLIGAVRAHSTGACTPISRSRCC